MPILRTPVGDSLRHGLGAQNLAQAHARGHPIAEMQKAYPQSEWSLKLQTLENVYGRHARVHAEMEAAILAQPLGAGPSAGVETLGLDTLLGNNARFAATDVFTSPFERPEAPVDALRVAEVAAAAAPAIPVGLMRKR